MDSDRIIRAAQRNRAFRVQQLAELDPLRVDARARADALTKQRDGAAETLRGIAQMRTLKLIPNFYPTPPAVIATMLAYAAPRAGELVLEPSAGKGNLCLALKPYGVRIEAVERIHSLAELVTAAGFQCKCTDFLTIEADPRFDLVLMNPPFEGGMDRDHILHAHQFLRPGGRLVAVAGATTARKLTSWAEDTGGEVIDLPANSFAASERPTGVSTGIVFARAA